MRCSAGILGIVLLCPAVDAQPKLTPTRLSFDPNDAKLFRSSWYGVYTGKEKSGAAQVVIDRTKNENGDEVFHVATRIRLKPVSTGAKVDTVLSNAEEFSTTAPYSFLRGSSVQESEPFKQTIQVERKPEGKGFVATIESAGDTRCSSRRRRVRSGFRVGRSAASSTWATRSRASVGTRGTRSCSTGVGCRSTRHGMRPRSIRHTSASGTEPRLSSRVSASRVWRSS